MGIKILIHGNVNGNWPVGMGGNENTDCVSAHLYSLHSNCWHTVVAGAVKFTTQRPWVATVTAELCNNRAHRYRLVSVKWALNSLTYDSKSWHTRTIYFASLPIINYLLLSSDLTHISSSFPSSPLSPSTTPLFHSRLKTHLLIFTINPFLGFSTFSPSRLTSKTAAVFL